MKIAFLGGGNMAGALVGGLIAKGFPAGSISVIEKLEAARASLERDHGVHSSAQADAATQAADTVVLAVKPQDLRRALAPLASLVREKLVLSIAAGVRLADISRWLGGHERLVRSMPNTPALIGAGISALYAPESVAAEDRARAEQVLAAVGQTVWVPQERLLDPVTAVSGSGPAYVFWFIEHLAAAGAALGLAEDTARQLALQTVLGAAQLAARSTEPVSTLRERVTSRGGTTEAALRVFAEEQMAERLHKALEAASRRGAELGEQLGRD
jgi:pyrroline-5-carboxylate reductase